MQWVWEKLAIAATSDKKAIRRAYADALRAMDPDADPDGFGELRSAREQAMWLADNPDWSDDDTDLELCDYLELSDWSPLSTEPQPAGELTVPSEESAASERDFQAPAEPSPVAERAKAEILGLLAIDAGTATVAHMLREATAALLADPEMYNIAHAEQVEDWLIDTILDQSPKSDAMIGVALDFFGWREDDEWGETDWRVPELLQQHRDHEAISMLKNPTHFQHEAFRLANESPSRLGLFARLVAARKVASFLHSAEAKRPSLLARMDQLTIGQWQEWFNKADPLQHLIVRLLVTFPGIVAVFSLINSDPLVLGGLYLFIVGSYFPYRHAVAAYDRNFPEPDQLVQWPQQFADIVSPQAIVALLILACLPPATWAVIGFQYPTPQYDPSQQLGIGLMLAGFSAACFAVSGARRLKLGEKMLTSLARYDIVFMTMLMALRCLIIDEEPRMDEWHGLFAITIVPTWFAGLAAVRLAPRLGRAFAMVEPDLQSVVRYTGRVMTVASIYVIWLVLSSSPTTPFDFIFGFSGLLLLPAMVFELLVDPKAQDEPYDIGLSRYLLLILVGPLAGLIRSLYRQVMFRNARP